MPEAALAVRGLCHTYGTGRAAVRALEDVTLAFAPGAVHLVMGPSGSGKTTLLSVLGCLLTPDAGEVRLLGCDVTRLAEEHRTTLRRRHIGFVFQAFRLFRSLSAVENVMVALDIAGRPGREARQAAEAALEAVGLADRRHRRPHELSGGEKQRVAVARALVNGPEVVLADEPTASLDAVSGLQVAALLRRLATDEGRVVAVVSHDPRLRPYADRVVVLESGRVVEDGGGAR